MVLVVVGLSAIGYSTRFRADIATTVGEKAEGDDALAERESPHI